MGQDLSSGLTEHVENPDENPLRSYFLLLNGRQWVQSQHLKPQIVGCKLYPFDIPKLAKVYYIYIHIHAALRLGPPAPT